MHKLLTVLTFLAILTPAANAAAVHASIALNVRTNPGTGYTIVDTLKPGAQVTITRCRGNWCLISHSGANGWVSAGYLTRWSTNRSRFFKDPCDVGPSTGFHLRFGLAHSPLGKYCRERND